MEAIRIQHLRSLSDSTRVEFRPLTILLGANSSGKSSFIRTIPLLRQSVETRTTGPILWYGRLVDFGSFEEAHQLGVPADSISFTFYLKTPTEQETERFAGRVFYGVSSAVTAGSMDVELTLVLKRHGALTYASEYRIRFLDDELVFGFNADARCILAQIDGENITERMKDYSLLPLGQIFQVFGNQTDSADLASGSGRRYFRNIVNSLENLLLRECSAFFDGRTGQDRRLATLHHLSIGGREEMLHQLNNIPRQDEKWGRRVAALTINSPQFLAIRKAALLARMPRLLTFADQHIVRTFSQARYIAPVRASAERFYRGQNLAVDEVDSKGENLPMFLSSLSNAEQRRFEDWTMKELGFSVKAHADGAHVTLRLTIRGSDQSLNLTDLGFGFSQILPVVALIWHSTEGPKSRLTYTSGQHLESGPRLIQRVIAIEQPELHLHPEMQALVIDMIARVIRVGKASKNPFVFFIETHSETIINRLGQLISTKTIEAEDVQTLIFEKKTGSNESQVRHSTFNSEGTLNDWPYGFFLPRPFESDVNRD